jgi:hypothetical protein
VAQANCDRTGFATRLSSLIRDPIVRGAFQRAERTNGQTFAIPDDLPKRVDFEDVRASDKPSSRKCHRGAAS